jgi:hypothetical protein
MKNNFGIFEHNSKVITYQISAQSENEDFVKTKDLFETPILRIGDYNIAAFGDNNMLPLEVKELVKNNKLLPNLIETQQVLLYGDYPYLYQLVNKEGVQEREAVEDAEITNWLESWDDNGFLNYRDYLIRVIDDFYHTKGFFTRFIFNKGRRLKAPKSITALEHVAVDECRLASDKPYSAFATRLKEKDFQYVAVADWLNANPETTEIFPKFNESRPFDYNNPIAYSRYYSFAEPLYSYAKWFFGLRQWIRGANNSPKYINDFLKNSLSAKLHVLIPNAWIDKQASNLEKLCDENKDLISNGLTPNEEYKGVKLTAIVNNQVVALGFREQMVIELINNELRKITELMSGEGENQGKIFTSQKFLSDAGLEAWEFQEIPMKYKEYIQAQLDYDKRADDSIIAGFGLDNTIANISKEGMISKSGSDAYYNYLIYLTKLSIPEYVCTWAINRAIHLNFPNKKNIWLGFYHNVPKQQQEVTPNDRMPNTAAN